MLVYRHVMNMIPVLTVRPVTYLEDRENTTKNFARDRMFHGRRAPSKYKSEASALESSCSVKLFKFNMKLWSQ